MVCNYIKCYIEIHMCVRVFIILVLNCPIIDRYLKEHLEIFFNFYISMYIYTYVCL